MQTNLILITTNICLLFIQAFPGESLTPKHHFMSHYGEAIRRHGPLSKYWCMRYEGKHRFAKLVANVSCKLLSNESNFNVIIVIIWINLAVSVQKGSVALYRLNIWLKISCYSLVS